MSRESALIDDLYSKYQDLNPEKKAELDEFIDRKSKTRLWFPTVGPQLDAINCLADILLFGGEGGGGKTDLILGLAFEYHQRSLIIRKHYTDLTALLDRAKIINTTEKGYKGSIPPRLKTTNGKVIDFGGLANPTDHEHWQGQPHDLLAIDEVVQNRESQVRFLMGWVRSEDPKQRKRIIFGSNPPIDSSGDWIIPMFAPWLDPRYPRPAKHGELRWCVTFEDEAGNSKDLWVDGPDAKIPSGKLKEDGSEKWLIPMSRTFIPSKLADNPFYAGTGYEAQLDALPANVRAAVRDGNFMAARIDDAYQVIPTEWVRRAQDRWRAEPPYGVPMCAIGVDCARKKDQTVLAPRHDGWYAPLIAVPGIQTPHGTDAAALVIKHRRHDAVVIIDVGETVGAQCYAHLKDQGIEVRAHLGIDPSVKKSAEKQLGFFNKRAELYWLFMEALDPGQDGGSPIALPDDPELTSDLTALRWTLTANGIKVTSKRDVVAELGRSTDKGDAVVQAWSDGPKAITHWQEWRPDQRVGKMPRAAGRRQPQVDFGPRHRHGPRRQ